jgi:predicted lipid-binding transport protein (Tim44 family)
VSPSVPSAVRSALAATGPSAPVAAEQSASASTPAAEPVAQSEALPPPAAGLTGGHASLGGWRAGVCGVFLILAGLTLITRRVLTRGPESRRS